MWCSMETILYSTIFGDTMLHFFCLEANMKIGYGITESATRRSDENDTQNLNLQCVNLVLTDITCLCSVQGSRALDWHLDRNHE